MPASAIEVSFCGAATTASTSPLSAALMAAPAKASAARPAAALLVPNASAAASGSAQSSTLSDASDQSASAILATTRKLTAIPQALACRSTTRASLATIGLQAARTLGSSAALRLISGPMPAGSPVAMAIFALSRGMTGSWSIFRPTPTASGMRGSRPGRPGRRPIGLRGRRPSVRICAS